jgi:hypothetical protein
VSLFALAAGDFNGDGKLDVAVANSGFGSAGGAVSVLLGNGDGTFQAPQSFPTDFNPVSVAVADLNGDGKLDIVTADSGGADVTVLLGNGDGNFQSPQFFDVGSTPTSVAVGDFNHDGVPDLVVANSGDNTVSLLLGAGGGSFSNPLTFPVGTTPVSVAAADVNGDGLLDVVTANRGSNDVTVLLGNGAGNFQAPLTFAAGSGPTSVAAADVNGDGRPDLVVADGGSNSVSVLVGNGDGTFQAPLSFAVGVSPSAVVVADVNGDGKPDLVVANPGSTTVSVLANTTPTGAATPTFAAAVNLTIAAGLAGVAVGDFNGDGAQDLATITSAPDQLTILLSTTPQARPVTFARPVATGTILESDAPPVVSPAIFAVGAGPGGLPLVDVYDAATGAFKYQFQAFETGFTGGTRVAVAHAADGHDYIAVAAGPGGFLVRTFRAGPNGVTDVAQIEPFGLFTGGINVALGDLNGDGVPDVVCGADAEVPITFSPQSLPTPVIGVPYSQTVTAGGGGGAGGLTLSVNFLAPLPPGLSAAVHGNALTISGTPTGPGTFNFTLNADDGAAVNGEPVVNVWSLDGTTRLSPDIFAFEHGFHGGVRVAVGDVDGDGKLEIIAAAGPGGLPFVQIIDGQTFRLLRRFEVFGTGFQGGVTVAAGVLDASGVARILVGADAGDGSPNDEPVMRTFDGGGDLLTDYVSAFEPGYHGGVNVAVSRDGRGQAWALAAPARAHAPQVNVFSAAFTLLPQSFTVLDATTKLADANFANGVALGG